MTQGVVFVLLVQYRFLNVGLLQMLAGAVLRPLAAGLGLAILVYLTRDFARSTVTLIACLVAAGVVYAALTVAVRVWSMQEINLLNQMSGGVWSRFAAQPLARWLSPRT